VLVRFVLIPRWLSNVLAAGIIAGVYGPLRNWLTNATERYLFQKKYDYKELLKRFTDEVMLKVDLKQLLETTVKTLTDTVKLDGCSLLLLNKDTRRYELAAATKDYKGSAVLAAVDVRARRVEHLARRQRDAQLEARLQTFELAFRMQSEASDAFDISREPEALKKLYGENTIGRQLLITRRLLERGVRFIQVWSGAGQPWDNHDGLEAQHRKLAGEWDPAIAAFLTDLKQLGLFDTTLIQWGGEFGRTPVAELPGLSGRDHNHYGFSCWLAGGGIRGGHVHGATDDFGFAAVENRVHVHDLHATMLHLLGFDHERLTYRYAGRDFRLTDVHGQVVKELIA